LNDAERYGVEERKKKGKKIKDRKAEYNFI